jgi:hypothetical protein
MSNMIGHRRFRWATRALLGAAVLLAAVPADAGERRITLGYEAYVGGFNALSVGLDAGLQPHGYVVDFRFSTQGAVSWLVSWTMNAFSRGAVQDLRIVPVSAGADSLWSGRKRTTRLDYRSDGSVAVEIVPPIRDADERTPVPDALKRGTVDLTSALLATLRAVGQEGRCQRREKVFDGRRRYDMVFEDGGRGRLGADAPTVYHGPTVVCRLSLEHIAGFRKTSSGFGWAKGEEAYVHVAKIFEGSPPVPVALEYDTGIGLLRAYLTEATFADGERQERLATNAAEPRPSQATPDDKEETGRAAAD